MRTQLLLRERYRRSVDLVRDFQRRDRLEGYIVTPTAADSFRRILNGLLPEATERAWSLVGPYGSGKSSFALFASAALDYSESDPLDGELRRQVSSLAPEAAELWAEPQGRFDRNSLLPVLVTGDRQPLARKLLTSLLEACARLWPRRKPNEFATLAKYVERMRSGEWLPSAVEVAELVDSLREKISASTTAANGILLVIDEFGKHLEFSTVTGQSDDAYMLQLLAEAAARSRASPLIVLTIQHQALDAYASSASRTQIDEWRKVQGRFEQVNFQETSEQLFALMGNAVRNADRVLTPEQVRVVETGAKLFGGGFRTLEADTVLQHLTSLVPVHPTVATLLPALFRRVGQNERSLFAFIASEEPGSLSDIFRTEPETEWYRLSHLYDYIISTFGPSLAAGPNAKRWSELEYALKRGHDLGALERDVVKTIGLLRLIGEVGGLASDHAGLAYALGRSEEELEPALEILLERRLIVWRAFANSFALWEGSDVDIEERLRIAETQVVTGAARALRDYLPAKSVVARRHSIETGTLRYFDVVYLDESSGVENLTASAMADGLILLLVSRDTAQAKQLIRATGDNADRPVLVGVIDQPLAVGEIISHIERLRWVQRNTEALAGDAVARRELEARQRHAHEKLRIALGGGRVGDAVQAFASTARWYTRGDPVPIESERQFNEVLSALCDDVYWGTPAITNEILNRRSISSTAARAQRILLEAMAESRSEARLGIEGAPPELSMYYSVLQAPGLHIEARGGVYRYSDMREHSNPKWQAIGNSIDELLKERSGEPLLLSEVANHWKQPPFGLKDGVVPVILGQLLLSREDDLVLYEDELFVPQLTPPHLERLSKDPSGFSIRSVSVSGLSQELFDALIELFPANRDGQGAFTLLSGEAGKNDEPQLLRIVRPLVKLITSLPEYTLSTSDLSPQTRTFRDVILRARDPLKLLLSDLPEVFGVDPGTDRLEFATRMRAALRELQHHYSRRTVDLIYELVLKSVGEDPAEEGARAAAVRRAAALRDIVTEFRLKGFLMRIADESRSREQWCESIASVVAHKPPRKWVDADRQKFEVEVVSLGRRMRDTEAAAFQHLDSQGVDEGDAYRAHLALTQTSGEQISRVVRLSPKQLERVRMLSNKLRSWLSEEGAADEEVQLAVLAHGWENIAGHSDRITTGGD